MLDILQNKYTPETLPYHIVVPSLPGYAFSELPTSTFRPLDDLSFIRLDNSVIEQDTSVVDVGRWMNELAIGLGFGDGYVLQGGDLGSRLARVMTVYPGCKGKDVTSFLLPMTQTYAAVHCKSVRNEIQI